MGDVHRAPSSRVHKAGRRRLRLRRVLLPRSGLRCPGRHGGPGVHSSGARDPVQRGRQAADGRRGHLAPRSHLRPVHDQTLGEDPHGAGHARVGREAREHRDALRGGCVPSVWAADGDRDEAEEGKVRSAAGARVPPRSAFLLSEFSAQVVPEGASPPIPRGWVQLPDPTGEPDRFLSIPGGDAIRLLHKLKCCTCSRQQSRRRLSHG